MQPTPVFLGRIPWTEEPDRLHEVAELVMTEQRLSTHTSVYLSMILEREPKQKGLNRIPGGQQTNKQTNKKLQKVKNLLNFWKGFIRHCTNADPKAPAHILVVNLILGAKCLR